MEVVYAVEIAKLSRSDLEVIDVKIGKTKNLKSTISQYRRLQGRKVPIKDLWKPNEDLSLSDCEKGVHSIAEKHAYEREGEKFIFLQDSYNQFSNNVCLLLKSVSEEEAKDERDNSEGNQSGEDTKMKSRRETNVEGDEGLESLENGTELRHKFKRGNHKGKVAKAKVFNGDIYYKSEKMTSPSSAAEKAVKDIKGKEQSRNGWTWWEFYDEEENSWRKIDMLRS